MTRLLLVAWWCACSRACVPFKYAIGDDVKVLPFLPGEDNHTAIAHFLAELWSLSIGGCESRGCAAEVLASALAAAAKDNGACSSTPADHLVITSIPKTGSRSLVAALKAALLLRQSAVRVVWGLGDEPTSAPRRGDDGTREPVFDGVAEARADGGPPMLVSCPHFTVWNLLVAHGAFDWEPPRAMRDANASLESTYHFSVDDDDGDDGVADDGGIDDDDDDREFARARRAFWRFARACDAALAHTLRARVLPTPRAGAGVAYVEHLGFVGGLGPRVARVAVLREPLDWFVSHFLFALRRPPPDGLGARALAPTAADELVRAVRLARGAERGDDARERDAARAYVSFFSALRDAQTRYVCGHAARARGSAIACALANLVDGFAAVGLLEELELSLEVFERALPRFFCGVANAARTKSNIVAPRAGDATRPRELRGAGWLPDDVRAAAQRWLADDLVLYAAARARLHARARGYGLLPTSS